MKLPLWFYTTDYYVSTFRAITKVFLSIRYKDDDDFYLQFLEVLFREIPEGTKIK